MKETILDKKWIDTMAEFFDTESGEITLVLDKEKTSIEITTETGKTIELKPTKNEKIKITKQNQTKTTIPKQKLIKKLIEKIETTKNVKIKTKNFINRSLLACLIKLRTLLKNTPKQTVPEKDNSPVNSKF